MKRYTKYFLMLIAAQTACLSLVECLLGESDDPPPPPRGGDRATCEDLAAAGNPS